LSKDLLIVEILEMVEVNVLEELFESPVTSNNSSPRCMPDFVAASI